jgi:S1-C subfamily serine protease
MFRAFAIVGLTAAFLLATPFGAEFKAATRTPQDMMHRSPYFVDGLALGGKVHFDSKAYREYSCNPSDTFSDFTWCQKRKIEKTPIGEVTSVNSILHNEDGTALYVNRYIEPAFFGARAVQSELDRLSAKFGERPRLHRLPTREALPNAIIAVWGKIKLEQLDNTEVSQLAEGISLHNGLLLSYLGSIKRSAKARLPVYRLAGGAGFVWAASFDGEGRGTLRFLTVDASKLAPQETAQAHKPSPPQSVPSEPPPQNGEEESSSPVTSYSFGTAFFVASNHLLTNNHVVANCKGRPALRYPDDINWSPAIISGLDAINDLAMLRTETPNASTASFSSRFRLGESVAAFGFPYAGVLSHGGNFTVGNVTALSGMKEDTRFLQISTPVQPGNSGGPLLDMSGNVVGVVDAQLDALAVMQAERSVPQNVNFAIRASIALNFLSAQGIATSSDVRNAPKLTPDGVAEVAKKLTVQVGCETDSPRTSSAGHRSGGANFNVERRR